MCRGPSPHASNSRNTNTICRSAYDNYRQIPRFLWMKLWKSMFIDDYLLYCALAYCTVRFWCPRSSYSTKTVVFCSVNIVTKCRWAYCSLKSSNTMFLIVTNYVSFESCRLYTICVSLDCFWANRYGTFKVAYRRESRIVCLALAK